MTNKIAEMAPRRVEYAKPIVFWPNGVVSHKDHGG